MARACGGISLAIFVAAAVRNRRGGIETPIRAAFEFRDEMSRPNELWQIDFTNRKIIGWGWLYHRIIHYDCGRDIIACPIDGAVCLSV